MNESQLLENRRQIKVGFSWALILALESEAAKIRVRWKTNKKGEVTVVLAK